MADNLQMPASQMPTAEDRHTTTGTIQLPGGWTKHAPPGGIILGGTFYKGGQFIPKEALQEATPEELKELSDKLNNARNAKNNPGGGISPSEQVPTGLENAEQPEMPAGFKHYVYLMDNGDLIGQNNGHFGSFILRNSLADQPLVHGYEVRMLHVLRTQNLHIIVPPKAVVVQIVVAEGESWPDLGLNDKDDIFHQLAADPHITINSIPLQNYDILKTIEPTLAQALMNMPTPQQASQPSAVGMTNMRLNVNPEDLYWDKKISKDEWLLFDLKDNNYIFNLSLGEVEPVTRSVYTKVGVATPINITIHNTPGILQKNNTPLEKLLHTLLKQRPEGAVNVEEFKTLSLTDITTQLQCIATALRALEEESKCNNGIYSNEAAASRIMQMKEQFTKLVQALNVEIGLNNNAEGVIGGL